MAEEVSVVNVPETEGGKGSGAAAQGSAQGQAAVPGNPAEPTAAPATGTGTEGETAPPAGGRKPGEVKTPAVSVAPEKYEFKLPDGFVANDESLSEVTPLLKELNVPMDKAQALMDLHFKEQARIEAEQKAAQAEVIKGWGDALKKDPEIGGQKLNENLSYANKLLKAHGSEELNKLLVDTGMDRQPDVVRFLVKVGKVLAEDRFIDAVNKGGAVPKTLEELGQAVFKKSLGGN